MTSFKRVVYVAREESLLVCCKKVQFLVNELSFDRIFLQNEYMSCNYNPRFPPAIAAHVVLTSVGKHETGPTTRCLCKQKPFNCTNPKSTNSSRGQPITCGGNLG